MKNKLILIAICFLLHACDTSNVASSELNSQNTSSKVSLLTDKKENESIDKLLHNLVSDPSILRKPWAELKTAFPKNCAFKTKGSSIDKSTLVCPEFSSDVENIIVLPPDPKYPESVGSIVLSLSENIDCTVITKIITDKLNSPSSSDSSSQCDNSWDLGSLGEVSVMSVPNNGIVIQMGIPVDGESFDE